MIRLKPISREHLTHRKVGIDDTKKVPLTFEYVLIFFMLPKDTLYNARSIINLDKNYEPFYHNIYHFSHRKGIMETHDNERFSTDDPHLWDADSWLMVLNVYDYNKGVDFFLDLWELNQAMVQQGRECDFYYHQGQLLCVETTPSLCESSTQQELKTEPGSSTEKHNNKRGKKKYLLLASLGFLALLCFPFLKNKSQPKRPADIFNEVLLDDRVHIDMFVQRSSADELIRIVNPKGQENLDLAELGEDPPSRYRVFYVDMYPGE